jgi:hypothetical protein
MGFCCLVEESVTRLIDGEDYLKDACFEVAFIVVVSFNTVFVTTHFVSFIIHHALGIFIQK